MTRHPGKTKAQIKYLDRIGCGEYDAPCSKKTIDALLKNGVIRQCGEKVFQDRFGLIKIPEYEMTISAHMQWCEYQSTQYGGETE